jgi:3-dehydroquinate dehydratase/shikimate dehydrogenase
LQGRPFFLVLAPPTTLGTQLHVAGREGLSSRLACAKIRGKEQPPAPVPRSSVICISINQESRRLALVDMHNAAPQCDLLEIRLDRFGMAPELGQLLAAKPRPVIMSCRRPDDGGHWDGSEQERLAILRQAIVSKADYVEIELDAADQIRRFPPSQRVISYTIKPDDTAEDIAARYEEAQTKSPDVIKLTTLAKTPEEAWPLVQILGHPRVPTVVVGLGKPGVMLTVLAKKIGAPWTYAALEKGMEAYPGQPTVAELRDIYRYGDIGSGTRLMGVTGFGQREYANVALLNAALAHLQLPARCLPLGVGTVRLFRKIAEAVKLAGVVVDGAHQEAIVGMAAELHPTATQAKAADLVLHKADKWVGYHTQAPVALAALLETLKKKSGQEEPLRNRPVAVAGLGGLARTLAVELTRRGAGVILASHDRKAAQQLAQEVGCRQILLEGLYSTLHDVLIVCGDEQTEGRAGIHHGYLKDGMTVMDLTAGLRASPLLREARARGCAVVEPRTLFLEQVELQVKMITARAVPREVLEAAVPNVFDEEESE